VAFSPDGKTLATTAADGSVRLWDVAKGEERRSLAGPGGAAFRSLAFSPDGQLVAAGTSAGTVRVWNAATGLLNVDLKYAPARFNVPVVNVLGFSADSKTVVVQIGGDVVVREVAGGKEVLRALADLGHVALSADGKLLAWGPSGYGQKDPILLYDMAKGKPRDATFTGHTGHVLAVALAPDGKSLVAASADNSIRLWDVATRKELRQFKGQPDWVRIPLAFAPDGKTLAAGSARGVITLWDVATGKLRAPGEVHDPYPMGLAFAPDGKALVTSDGTSRVRLWDTATGALVRGFNGKPDDDPRPGASSLGFVPDGKMVVQTYQYGKGARLWDAATGKETLRLDGYATALARDGKTLAVAETANEVTVSLRDAATGEELRRLAGPEGRVLLLRFSPDAKVLTACVQGKTDTAVCSWDAATGKVRHVPKRLSQPGSAVALSGDGRTLALNDLRGGIHVWDLTAWEEVRSVPGSGCALSADGRLVAVWGPDFTVAVREVVTGLERLHFAGHEGPIVGVTFAADGRGLASASQDGSAIIWDLTGRQKKGRPKPAGLTAAQCEALWADLGAADGEKANRAVWNFVGDPATAVAFLRQHLKPVSPDGTRPKRLVADLDSDELAARQQAVEELGKLGSLAAVNLRRGLEEKPSLDATRRIKELLECLQPGKAPAPGWMRAWRAMEVLEAIGTPEARKVLEAMAEGAKPADLTRAAKASLERLAGP
jgi:WD40 repeat protein